MSTDLSSLSGEEVSWSVYVADAETGQSLLRHAVERALATASVAKVFALTELASRFESGSIDRMELLDRRSTPRVADSGIWHRLSTERLPATDVATLIASVSDNWATNVVIEKIGLAAIQNQVATYGLDGSVLLDLVRNERTEDHAHTLSVGSSLDWVRVMTRLHQGTWVSRGVSEQVLTRLYSSMDYSLVLSALDRDPLVMGNQQGFPVVANKTGSDFGVRADTGLVKSEGRAIAYACIANWAPDRPDLLQGVLATMRQVGLLISAELELQNA